MPVVVVQAAAQRGAGSRVQQDRAGSAPEPDGRAGQVDVGDAQLTQLGGGGAMRQAEQARGGLVGLQAGGAGCPPAQELALLGRGQQPAVEWVTGAVLEAADRFG
jgi:hypothetical protein